MNTDLTITSVIEETRQLLEIGRRSLLKVAANLHFLKEKGEYEGKFGAYAEETFGLHPSMTSKLTNAYEAWVIKAGIAPEKLEGLDHQRLYDYIPLLEGKEPDQALAEVRAWSRADIRAEKQEKTPCEHKEIHNVCTDCWAVVDNETDTLNTR